MYTEHLRMAPRLAALLAAPFLFVIALLTALQLFVPLPLAGRLPIFGVMLLEAAIGALLVGGLSRVRIAIDERAVTVAFRFLFRKRIPLERIVRCSPTDARVWGMAYRSGGMAFRPRPDGGRGVLLTLTNGAQVVFSSRHATAVCAALRTQRSEIA
jgi:hypothetical protein